MKYKYINPGYFDPEFEYDLVYKSDSSRFAERCTELSKKGWSRAGELIVTQSGSGFCFFQLWSRITNQPKMEVE